MFRRAGFQIKQVITGISSRNRILNLLRRVPEGMVAPSPRFPEFDFCHPKETYGPCHRSNETKLPKHKPSSAET